MSEQTKTVLQILLSKYYSVLSIQYMELPDINADAKVGIRVLRDDLVPFISILHQYPNNVDYKITFDAGDPYIYINVNIANGPIFFTIMDELTTIGQKN